MSEPYSIRLEPRFGAGELIDLQPLVEANTARWYNETLCLVNDSMVRLGVLEGEYHWHKHDNEDEFFYVVEGTLRIEVEGEPPVSLRPRQAYVVPKGVSHRPIAVERVIVLMIEQASVRPTGD
jgi:mannose-6-phosphate isomerase-like protein (cupin superfamily)